MSRHCLVAEPAPSAQTAEALPNLVRRNEAQTSSNSFDTDVSEIEPGIDVTRLTVRGGSGNILDDDAARSLVTRLLLNEIAPALGLDPARIKIQVNKNAESRLNGHGAIGLSENSRIYLHPGRYKPLLPEGRYLLAHELAHAAQRRTDTSSPLETPRAHALAEEEASRIGRAFMRRDPLVAPQIALQSHTAAAEDVAPPKLEASIAVSRAREITAIKRLLSGWWISDGDVFGVMRILDELVFPVAKALVHGLGKKERYELADNINTPHIRRHRKSVLACYAALEPGEFGAIDLDVLEDGPLGGLDPEEREALLYTVRSLKDGQKRDLLESDNRREIKQLILAPVPVAEDPAERKKREDKIAWDEAKLAEQRKEIESFQSDTSIGGIIEEIRDALKHTESSHPVEVLELLTQQRSNRNRFLYIAEQMEAQGLIDRLIEDLPAPFFFADKEHTETLIGLVQSRLPSKNIELVESLLSYGLFDWAIRDYEAQFAYRIIKLLPLSQQYRFRQRDNGKWFMRLVQNLPESFTKTAEFEGDIEIRKASKEQIEELSKKGIRVSEEDLLYDATQLYQKKRGESGVQAQIDALIEKFKEIEHPKQKKDEKSDTPVPTYESLHREIAVIGNARLVKGEFQAADQVLMETIVHYIDRLGYIDKLFSNLSEKFLFSEANRITTVKIMMARDPVRVQYHARELVSRGFTDWMVKDNEAYLAYLCVKALPDEEREAFVSGDKWDTILGEMSADMRQSRDLNMYVGDQEGTDRANVLGQLAESNTWTGENAPKLDALVRMSIAMTEHKFAFARSEEFEAYKKPGLQEIVTKYKLYDKNAGRTKYTPDILKGTKWYEEGLFATLRTIFKGLVFLFDNDLLLITRSVGGYDINLNQLQDVMGGDINGAKLAAPEKSKDSKKESNPDTNKLTVLIDVGAHAAQIWLPELKIESVNFQGAGQTIQAGNITLKGLYIDVAYDTEELQQPTYARLETQSLELRDLLVAFRTKMAAVNRLFLGGLHVGAGTVDTKTQPQTAPRDGYYFPVPFLATIGTLIYYLFKFKGWGTDTPAVEMAHGAEQIKAMEVTFSSLEVSGLTTSGGQSVASIKVADFALRVGMNKATMLRAQIGSLEQRAKRLRDRGDTQGAEKLQQEKEKAKSALDALKKDEKRLIIIQDKILHGGISKEEESKLQTEIEKINLEAEGGAFLDIGSIEASGISGTVSAKSPLKLENLHGEGKSPAMAAGFGLGVVTDAELIKRVTKGTEPKPLAEQGGDFRLEIEKFRAEEVSVGHGIRTSKDIEAKLKELEPEKDNWQIAPYYQQLQELQLMAVRYDQYVALGVSSLDKAQLADFRNLRESLTKDPDIIFGTIDLTRVYISANLTTGGIGVGAEEATLSNIRLPERGLTIDEVKARGIGVNAGVQGGLAGWLDWKKNLQSAGAGADFLQIAGVRDRNAGLLFEKATLTGAQAGIKERGNIAEAGIGSLVVEGLGLVPRIGLLKQRLAGLEKKSNPTDAEKKEITQLKEKIPALEALTEQRAKAFQMRDKAKTPEERAAAEQAIMESEGAIMIGVAQYGAARLELDEFGIRATGAGDVLGDVLSGGFNLPKVLERGVTIQGTGPDDRLFKRFGLKNAHTKDDQSKSNKSLEVGEFEIGETKSNFFVKKDGNSLNVTINKFKIASVAMTQMLFTGFDDKTGGSQIWSNGTSTLQDLTLTGSLRLDAPAASDGTALGDYRLAHAQIDEFRIGQITANGLGYASLTQRLEVTIKSGSIQGLWARGLSIDFPTDPKAAPAIQGFAGIEAVNNVEIAAALSNGMNLERGTINATNLGLEFLKEGGIEASADDLSATAMSLRGPDGWARFSLSHLSGTVRMKDGVYTAKNVRLGSFEVSSLDWSVGPKRKIVAKKPAKLVNLRASGEIVTEQVPVKPKKGAVADPTKEPETETKLRSIKVTDFHIDSILAQHLLYQDEDIQFEIKEYDSSMPATMRDFQPLYIQNFDIHGLEWSSKEGLKRADVDLGKFEASTTFKSFKEGLEGGFALKGIDMGATFVGKDFAVSSLGIIEKTGGFFKGKGVDTSFGTGSIFGSVTTRPDYISLNGLEIQDLRFGKTTYTDGVDKNVVLGSAGVGKINIDIVEANLETVKDADGNETKQIKDINIGEIIFTDIHAEKFTYDGKSNGKTETGEAFTSTQHVEAAKAYIDRFTISKVHHNVASKLTKLSLKVDNREEKKPAFGVTGLAAKMVKTVGGKDSITELSTDIEGGPLTGDNIEFQTVNLGKVKKPDGTYESVTRTKVDGKFHLTRLGLLNPDLTLTDEAGVTTRIGSKYSYTDPGKIEITGINPQILPNGTAIIPIDKIKAHKLEITKRKPGSTSNAMSIDIPLVELTDFAASLKGIGTDKGIDLLGAKLKQISIPELTFTMPIDRAEKSTMEDYQKALKNPSPGLIVEPLSGMSGNATIDVSIDWLPDASIDLPTSKGTMEFQSFPYAVYLEPNRLRVGNFRANVKEIPFGRDIPGISDEKRYFNSTGGEIDLRKMLEGLANAPPSGAPDPNAKPGDLSGLKDIRIKGNFSLGGGKTGLDFNGNGVLDDGDAYLDIGEIKNAMEIPDSNLGNNLIVNLPAFAANGAFFPAGKTAEGEQRLGKTGAISTEKINISVEGLANLKFYVTITVKGGKIENVEIGDITLLDADKLKSLPEPTLKEVNPKGEPGTP